MNFVDTVFAGVTKYRVKLMVKPTIGARGGWSPPGW